MLVCLPKVASGCFLQEAPEERDDTPGVTPCRGLVEELLPRAAGQRIGIVQPRDEARIVVNLPPIQHRALAIWRLCPELTQADVAKRLGR